MTKDTAVDKHKASTPDTVALKRTGLEFVTGLADGSISSPPIAAVLPFTLLPPKKGKVTLQATPEARFYNPMGIVHGGWIMALLDEAMGLAAQTTLDPGHMGPTHETSIKFVRPISANSGPLRIIGYVVSAGRRVITLEGRAEDSQGRLYAQGTSTCLVVRKEV